MSVQVKKVLMKTILIPTDFSRCANNAAVFGLQLALNFGASVILFHNVFPSQGIDNSIYNVFLIEDLIKIKEKKLKSMVKKWQKKPEFANLDIKTVCEVGFITDAIKDASAQYNADLIVMGTKGATGIKEMVLGSNTSAVLASSAVPVIAVPEKAAFKLFAGNFVLATDFNIEINSKSNDFWLSLLRYYGAKVRVLHTYNAKSFEPSFTNEKKISDWLGSYEYEFDYMYDNNNMPLTIRDYVASVDGSLLCMIKHKHSFWHKLFLESTTKAVANHVQVPLLVLDNQ